MIDVRHITGWLLAVIMLAATAICVCAPDVAAASIRKNDCCHRDGPRSPQQHPGQDCPSCSWSVLRSAEIQKQVALDNPTIQLHAIAPIAKEIAPLTIDFGLTSCIAESPPSPLTLFDLHCQLLS